MSRSRSKDPSPPQSGPRLRLMSIREIAELGGFSVSTARRMIAVGRIPPCLDLGMPQLQRWHPLQVRKALGIEDLPEADE